MDFLIRLQKNIYYILGKTTKKILKTKANQIDLKLKKSNRIFFCKTDFRSVKIFARNCTNLKKQGINSKTTYKKISKHVCQYEIQ